MENEKAPLPLLPVGVPVPLRSGGLARKELVLDDMLGRCCLTGGWSSSSSDSVRSMTSSRGRFRDVDAVADGALDSSLEPNGGVLTLDGVRAIRA